MPQIKNKKFDLTRIEKIPSQVKNTKDFHNIKDFEKEKQGVLPTLSIPKDLIEQFRKEAKDKQWKLTTLMTNILKERYGKNDNESENK
ncbi:MAG: hypothetical protein H9Q65_05390 [Spiroplasma ixodetis]|nr:hypothetical protein [Spiroplasma ixodetis]MBP1528657.1 hypothetical protein [Spiroplasma ixodetis]